MLIAARTCAALAVLAGAGLARAQTLTVAVPVFSGDVENAVTVGAASSLTLELRHDDREARYQVDVRMPLTTYTALGGAGPSAAWTPSTYRSGGYWYVRYTAPCSGTGLAPNTPARFTIGVRPPSGVVAVDTRTSAFRVTVSVTRRNNGQCRTGSDVSNTTAAVTWARVLELSGSGTVPQQLAPPAVVRWAVNNYSTAQKTNVGVTPVPAGATCGSIASLRAYSSSAGPGTGSLLCRYPATAGQAYSVSAKAIGATSASAVGASVTGIDVGNATVTWTRSTLVRDRVRDPAVIVVRNDSRATVQRVEVSNAASGWAVSGATSSSGNLRYDPTTSTGPRVVFTGAIAPGESVTLGIRYAAIPAGSSFPFLVTLTPTSGSDYAVTYGPQAVAVRTVTVPPDVSGLTIRSDAGGQTLQWSNPTRQHAGVVVLRAVAPAFPSAPLDFVDYAATPTDEVVFANRTDAAIRAAADSTIGAFNYLVCNHDAELVYAECGATASASHHYAGSSAIAPDGGWTVYLGGEALAPIQGYAAGRAGVPTSRGDVSVITVADGRRAVTPAGEEIAPLQVTSALPSSYMPGWRLADGRLVAIAADEAGYLTAVDLEGGKELWRVHKAGESFSAGVSGVASTGGSPAFKAAYPRMDVLFLGSATTGNLLAIDASNGATLWTVSTGAEGVDALISYDAGTNFLWVPTSSGVQAWDLGPSRPGSLTPAKLAWDAPIGAHSMHCVRTTITRWMACVGSAGTLRLLDKTSGSVQGTPLETGVVLPSTVVRVAYGTPGFIVSSARQVARVVASDATLTSLSVPHRWQPSGWTFSPAGLFSASGYLIVGAADRTAQGIHLYKLSSEDLHDMGRSPDDVQAADPGTLIGTPAYFSTSGLYLFGTSEGRVWAIPTF